MNKIMRNEPNFRNVRNDCNLSNNKNYQQRTTNYELLKTNPNEPNLKVAF
jgi:hypothetical protein